MPSKLLHVINLIKKIVKIINNDWPYSIWLNLSHLDGPLVFLTKGLAYSMVKDVISIKYLN